MIRPNNSFVEALGGVNINDLMVFNDQRNDCITIYISASNNSLNMGFSDIYLLGVDMSMKALGLNAQDEGAHFYNGDSYCKVFWEYRR